MNELYTKIIYFLIERDPWTPYNMLLNEMSNDEERKSLESVKKELIRIGIIELDDNKNESYIMPKLIKDKIKNLPLEFKNNPYQYFLNEEINKNHEEENRIRKKDQVLDLTIDDLVDKIVDRPKYKNRLLRAEIISGLSALAAILTVILSMKKC